MSPTTSYRIRTGYTIATGSVFGYTLTDILRYPMQACLGVLLVVLCWWLNRLMVQQYERHLPIPTEPTE